jgi:mannonate dehydratase
MTRDASADDRRGLRIAFAVDGVPSEAALTLAAQLGLGSVLVWEPRLASTQRNSRGRLDGREPAPAWEYMELVRLRTRCEDFGLRLEAIENTPVSRYDRAMLGLPGRDEQIEAYQETIRNLGRAGIPILGFHWMPNGVWRTSFETRGRAGAIVSSFDADQVLDAPLSHGREYSEEELWDCFLYFLTAVVPVAEEAGVRLALHPDDPPVPKLGGIPRLFRSPEAFERAVELVPSPAFGLNFCMGTWSEMGVDVVAALRSFLERDRVVYVHFRDVQGVVPSFQECFLGEGNVDLVDFVSALVEHDFDGFMIDDHVPRMIGEGPGHARLARAHATGYMQGLLAAAKGSAV